jgi:flagellar assembly protein FliH
MGNIITEKNIKQHSILSYQFENLDRDKENHSSVDNDFQPLNFAQDNKTSINQPHQQESHEDLKRRDEMINNLLDKVDSLSSELLKVQIKLEEQDGIFTNQIDEVKKSSYEEGLKQGQIQIEQKLQSEYSSILKNFTTSIDEVNNLSKNLQSATNSIESELIKASVEIAKEVITSEISFNSGQVAINLSKSLLKQINDASTIKLHVNSSDYDSVKDSFKDMEHISIIPNRSVNQGGVIIVSDVGTIEGSIMERFKNLKLDILSKVE